MAQLPDAERERVHALVDCIADALTQRDDVELQYANKTKVQKLLYLAIDEFDIPITYSWYLAGAVLPGDSGTPGELETAFDDLAAPETPTIDSDDEQAAGKDTPDRVDDTDSGLTADDIVGISGPEEDGETIDPVLFTGRSQSDTEADDVPAEYPPEIADRYDEIVDFYRRKIPEVWHQNTMRFLQNFYVEHAPEEYREFYLQSTHLRSRLRTLRETVAARVEGEEPQQAVDEQIEAISLDLTDLHVTIRQTESIRMTFDGFLHGTNLIEDGLMMLANTSPDEFSQQHVDVIESMEDFFYYYVWRYPCLIISQETARGPSADKLRTERRQRLARFEDELRQQAAQFEQELDEAGLKPDYDDYEATGDAIDETIRDLAEQYFE